MRLVAGRIPPNGYHYPVAKGVELHAATREELVRLIFDYRLRQNIPAGDIDRDVDDYFCREWPSFCSKEAHEWAGQERHTPLPSNESLLARVTRWTAGLAAKMPKGGYSFVSSDEAKRRAGVCVGCPKNQPWRTGCRGCSGSTASLLLQLRQMKKLPMDSHLAGCSAGGFDNATAAWLPKESFQLTDNESALLWDRCWLR